MSTAPDYSDIEDFPDGRTPTDYERDYRRFLNEAVNGAAPLDDELSAAPVIRDWYLQRLNDPETEKELGYPVFQVWGYFEGHPYLPETEIAHSSPLLQIDPAGRWARCASRIYRLEHQKQ